MDINEIKNKIKYWADKEASYKIVSKKRYAYKQRISWEQLLSQQSYLEQLKGGTKERIEYDNASKGSVEYVQQYE